jgi:hypothetical protein
MGISVANDDVSKEDRGIVGPTPLLLPGSRMLPSAEVSQCYKISSSKARFHFSIVRDGIDVCIPQREKAQNKKTCGRGTNAGKEHRLLSSRISKPPSTPGLPGTPTVRRACPGGSYCGLFQQEGVNSGSMHCYVSSHPSCHVHPPYGGERVRR